MDPQEFSMMLWTLFKVVVPVVPVIILNKFIDVSSLTSPTVLGFKLPASGNVLLYAVGCWFVWENLGNVSKRIVIEVPYETSDGLHIKNNKACITDIPRTSRFMEGKDKMQLVFHVQASDYSGHKNIIFKHYKTVDISLNDHIGEQTDHISLFTIPKHTKYYKSKKKVFLVRKPPEAERNGKFYDEDLPNPPKP